MAKITNLNNLVNYIHSIEDINKGGCGIAALFIFKWIKKRYPNADVKMVYYYYENSQYRFEANNNYLKNNGGEPTSASHVVIKYKNVYFDSYRVNDGFKEYDYSFDTDNVDFVIKSITNKNEWNSWFNRDKWIPKMEKKIGIKLFGTLNN